MPAAINTRFVAIHTQNGGKKIYTFLQFQYTQDGHLRCKCGIMLQWASWLATKIGKTNTILCTTKTSSLKILRLIKWIFKKIIDMDRQNVQNELFQCYRKWLTGLLFIKDRIYHSIETRAIFNATTKFSILLFIENVFVTLDTAHSKKIQNSLRRLWKNVARNKLWFPFNDATILRLCAAVAMFRMTIAIIQFFQAAPCRGLPSR